jgi:hypothetical protein
MNLPLVLDVVVSLVFIYLALSLLASEIQELIATLLQWRARHLRDSITNLFSGGTSQSREQMHVGNLVDAIYDDPLVRDINQEARGAVATGFRQVTRWLFPGNRKGAYGQDRSTGPSYIEPETFATAFTERLGISTLVNQLVEIRLEKFIQKMVGSVTLSQDGVVFNDPSEVTGLREIANRHGIDLSKDFGFRGLAEDFQQIERDYKAGSNNLDISIERMSEAWERYFESYSVKDNPETAYYLDRAKAYKLSLFGIKNERVLLSGGLQPTIQEVSQIIDRGSSVYKEIAGRYSLVQNEAEAIVAAVNQRATELYESAHRVVGDNADGLYSSTDEELDHYVDMALGELTDEQYQTYRDYKAYRKAEQVLDRLPASLRESMGILARRAQSRTKQGRDVVNHFRDEVATWFDRSMSRASGVYKRNAKGVALLVGLSIAAFTNSDTFHILDRVASDDSLRRVVTDRAGQIAQQNATPGNLRPGQVAAELESLKNQTDQVLSDMPLPITWNPGNLSRQLGCPYDSVPASTTPGDFPYALLTQEQWKQLYRSCLPPEVTPNYDAPIVFQVLDMINRRPFAFLRMVSGWGLSGIAIAMGAPFWFDLLSRLMNVRNTGSKPKSSES